MFVLVCGLFLQCLKQLFLCTCMCVRVYLDYEGECSLQFLWHHNALHGEDKSGLIGHPCNIISDQTSQNVAK